MVDHIPGVREWYGKVELDEDRGFGRQSGPVSALNGMRQRPMPGLRLNLGCGTTAPSGWVNIDRSPGLLLRKASLLRAFLMRARVLRGPQADVRWPSNVRRHDVRKGLPFPPGSVEAVYSSHMVEHLPRDAAVRLVRECRRVLRDGGIVRIALPNLRGAAERYVASDASDAADEFMRAIGVGLETTPRGWSRLVETVSGARHRWMYDAASIQAICRECGFREVSERRYREGRCPDLASVEHRPDSIFIEAIV
jgi:SAM-dependent methyltransferase